MRTTNRFFFTIACALILGACSTNSLDELDANNNSTGGNTSNNLGDLVTFDIGWDNVADTDFTDATETVPSNESDDEYDDYVENSSFSSQIAINFSGTQATVSGAVDGVSVNCDGGNVVVQSSAKGVEYVLSGTATDGSIKIYSDKKFKLTLNGVSLTSQQGAAVNIQSSKRAFVEAASGTTNVLADAATYSNDVDGEDQKACLFSEGKLIFSGSGQLTITGNHKHAICSDDYVFVHSGTRLTVASAAKDAIHANDKIVIAGGLVKLSPSGDGLDCEDGNIDIRGGLLKASVTSVATKAVKAETDVTISGGQVILLTSGNAEYDSDDQDLSSAAGIKCGGNLSIVNATVEVKSTGQAGKGINCDGSLTVKSGNVSVITTGSQYVLGSLDSSPKGIKAKGDLTIDGGTIKVRALGGEGSEGIESKTALTVNGGTIGVYTYDDCLNATSSIAINGGQIYCYSTGNDAIDSNGTLSITGGTTVAVGTTTPEGGFDCDDNTFAITGGTLLGIGGTTSTPTSSACTQASVIYGGSAASGATLSVVAADGSHLMSFVLPQAYSQLSMLYSSPSLSQGGSYSIYSGGIVSGGTSFYSLTQGGTYSGGTSLASFSLSSIVTTVGNVGGSGGPNGGGGHGGGNGRP